MASRKVASIDGVHMATVARVVFIWSKQKCLYARLFSFLFTVEKRWVVQIAQCFHAVKFKAQGGEA